MDELWMRSVAAIYDGKIENFKRLAEELLNAIRDKDSDTLNIAIFLDEPTRVAVLLEEVAVFLEQYASLAGRLDRHAAQRGRGERPKPSPDLWRPAPLNPASLDRDHAFVRTRGGQKPPGQPEPASRATRLARPT